MTYVLHIFILQLRLWPKAEIFQGRRWKLLLRSNTVRHEDEIYLLILEIYHVLDWRSIYYIVILVYSSYLEQVQSSSNQVCPVWLFGLVVFYRLPSNVLLSSKDHPNQNKHCTHMSKAWYLLEILARFWMYF